jgi:hypothetical protein
MRGSDCTIADFLHRLLRGGRRASVGPMLDHTIVLARRGKELLSFKNVIGARLFYVDIFSSLTAPNSLQRMPMIRRGDGNGIKSICLPAIYANP